MDVHSLSAAFKWYHRFSRRYARRYGATLRFRLRNEIRREFSLVAAFKTQTSVHIGKKLITRVIEDVYPIHILEQKIKVLVQTVEKLGALRSQVLGMRNCRK